MCRRIVIVFNIRLSIKTFDHDRRISLTRNRIMKRYSSSVSENELQTDFRTQDLSGSS